MILEFTILNSGIWSTVPVPGTSSSNPSILYNVLYDITILLYSTLGSSLVQYMYHKGTIVLQYHDLRTILQGTGTA